MAGVVFVASVGAMSRGSACCISSSSPVAGASAMRWWQCVRFARAKGYRSVVLWTPALLEGARRRYVRRGFECGETAMYERFGVPLRGESRRRELAG